jgi:hypothetical protein
MGPMDLILARNSGGLEKLEWALFEIESGPFRPWGQHPSREVTRSSQFQKTLEPYPDRVLSLLYTGMPPSPPMKCW